MDATKKPSETCLFWALKHLVRPGDSVTVLGILHQITTPMGYKSQPNLSDFVGTNKATLEAEMSQKLVQFEDKLRILADLCDNRGVYLDITITAGSPLKSVMVKEAAKMKATHVLLDRHLKKDKKYYKEQLQCEVLAFSEKSQPERVREGNISHMFDNPGLPLTRINSASSSNPSSRSSNATSISLDGNSVPNSDVASSKDSICAADGRSRSQHSGDFPAEPDTQSAAQSAAFSALQLEDTSFIDLLMLDSPNGVTPIWSSAKDNKGNPSKKEISTDQANVNQEFRSSTIEKAGTHEGIISGPPNSILSSSINAHLGASNVGKSPLSTSYADNHMSDCSEKEVISVQPRKRFSQLNDLMRAHDFQSGINSTKKVIESKPSHPHGQADPKVKTESVFSAGKATESEQQIEKPMVFTEDAMVKHLSQAPPLCSICKFTSMELGRAPRVYEWRELKAVTNNFASENLIAEGGFSFVYRGIFPEGQTVAIKKLKTTTLQNDVQFATEVEALSYAQHRNLVRLLGYGVGDNNDRALVYEYVCNGSLDQHLSVQSGDVLQWSARYKIAIGAARGLRYLHEECRVGCIVHRDMRPNNILLTHDFEPMVGDFGLAKMNKNVDAAIETQVVGALGFLAPEYVEFGQVTSKTDVYAFGVVLLELISGRKAIDLQRPKGEISLVELARQKLRHHRVRELVDTRVAESLDMLELDMMIKAASLCITRDPHSRPGISQVLRILEGERRELSNEVVQDDPIFDRALQASSKSQTPEDLYQSSNRLQMAQSTKRLSAVPTSWRSWVRTS